MEARVQRSMVVTLFLVVGACQSAGDDVEQIRANIVTNATQGSSSLRTSIPTTPAAGIS
jgi:hypothetical protein